MRLLCKLRPITRSCLISFEENSSVTGLYIGAGPGGEQERFEYASVIKEAIRHVVDGKPLGIFPAGEVSSYQADSNHVEDKEWDSSVLKLVKWRKCRSSRFILKGLTVCCFIYWGMIHPVLKTIKLPSELLNKKNGW